MFAFGGSVRTTDATPLRQGYGEDAIFFVEKRPVERAIYKCALSLSRMIQGEWAINGVATEPMQHSNARHGRVKNNARGLLFGRTRVAPTSPKGF